MAESAHRSDAAPPVLHVPLRRPPLWYTGLSFLLVVGLAFALSAVRDAARDCAARFGESVGIVRYFPGISDVSHFGQAESQPGTARA